MVAGSEELLAWIRGFAILQGAIASPFDALNGLRGIRTLAVRQQVLPAAGQVVVVAAGADADLDVEAEQA